MASEYLRQKIQEYEKYIQLHGIDISVVEAYAKACDVAVNDENDISYGL